MTSKTCNAGQPTVREVEVEEAQHTAALTTRCCTCCSDIPPPLVKIHAKKSQKKETPPFQINCTRLKGAANQLKLSAIADNYASQKIIGCSKCGCERFMQNFFSSLPAWLLLNKLCFGCLFVSLGWWSKRPTCGRTSPKGVVQPVTSFRPALDLPSQVAGAEVQPAPVQPAPFSNRPAGPLGG